MQGEIPVEETAPAVAPQTVLELAVLPQAVADPLHFREYRGTLVVGGILGEEAYRVKAEESGQQLVAAGMACQAAVLKAVSPER